jgi:hypothetical protein
MGVVLARRRPPASTSHQRHPTLWQDGGGLLVSRNLLPRTRTDRGRVREGHHHRGHQLASPSTAAEGNATSFNRDVGRWVAFTSFATELDRTTRIRTWTSTSRTWGGTCSGLDAGDGVTRTATAGPSIRAWQEGGLPVGGHQPASRRHRRRARHVRQEPTDCTIVERRARLPRAALGDDDLQRGE